MLKLLKPTTIKDTDWAIEDLILEIYAPNLDAIELEEIQRARWFARTKSMLVGLNNSPFIRPRVDAVFKNLDATFRGMPPEVAAVNTENSHV